MKETQLLRNLMESVAYGVGEKKRLKEYFNQEGDDLVDVIKSMNVYFDIQGDEPIGYYDDDEDENNEYDDSPEWQAIVAKFTPMVDRLLQIAVRNNREITAQEADAADQEVYDGSDAYDSLDDSINFMPDIYTSQIKFIKALIDGTIDYEDYTYESSDRVLGEAGSGAAEVISQFRDACHKFEDEFESIAPELSEEEAYNVYRALGDLLGELQELNIELLNDISSSIGS